MIAGTVLWMRRRDQARRNELKREIAGSVSKLALASPAPEPQSRKLMVRPPLRVDDIGGACQPRGDSRTEAAGDSRHAAGAGGESPLASAAVHRSFGVDLGGIGECDMIWAPARGTLPPAAASTAFGAYGNESPCQAAGLSAPQSPQRLIGRASPVESLQDSEQALSLSGGAYDVLGSRTPSAPGTPQRGGFSAKQGAGAELVVTGRIRRSSGCRVGLTPPRHIRRDDGLPTGDAAGFAPTSGFPSVTGRAAGSVQAPAGVPRARRDGLVPWIAPAWPADPDAERNS